MNGTTQIIIGFLVTCIGALTLASPGGWDALSGLNLFLGGLLIGMGFVFRVLER